MPSYGDNRSSCPLNLPIGPERGNYAEETARLIDAEVKRIMSDAHTEARRILTEHRSELETVTRRLLEQEVMEGEELRTLLGLSSAAPEHSPDTTPLPPGIQ